MLLWVGFGAAYLLFGSVITATVMVYMDRDTERDFSLKDIEPSDYAIGALFTALWPFGMLVAFISFVPTEIAQHMVARREKTRKMLEALSGEEVDENLQVKKPLQDAMAWNPITTQQFYQPPPKGYKIQSMGLTYTWNGHGWDVSGQGPQVIGTTSP